MRDELRIDERTNALRYYMFLKQKNLGKIKAQGCADGRPQRKNVVTEFLDFLS